MQPARYQRIKQLIENGPRPLTSIIHITPNTLNDIVTL